MTNHIDIIVTRHVHLIQYARDKGFVGKEVPILAHAKPEDIEGKNVFGVLPLSLAVLAASVTEIPLLGLPAELRGKELTLEQVAQYAGLPVTYEVQRQYLDTVTKTNAVVCLERAREAYKEDPGDILATFIKVSGFGSMFDEDKKKALDWIMKHHAKTFDSFFGLFHYEVATREEEKRIAATNDNRLDGSRLVEFPKMGFDLEKFNDWEFWRDADEVIELLDRTIKRAKKRAKKVKES